MQFQTFVLDPVNIPEIAAQLNFDARAVQVDNYTNQYVYVPDAAKKVPPYCYGAIFPINGTQVGRAKLLGASLIESAPPTISADATLTFFGESLPPNSGMMVQVTTNQPNNTIDTVTINSGPVPGTVTKSYTLSDDTRSLVVVPNAGGGTNTVTITGNDTGFLYLNGVPTNGVIAFTNIYDQHVTVVYHGSASSVQQFTLVGLPTEISVGSILGAVTVTSPAPPELWGKLSVGFTAAPGALNTDFTVIPGIAGVTLYVHAIVVDNNTGNNWEVDLWDGPSAGGLRVGRLSTLFDTGVGIASPVNWDGKGRQLTVGNSLVGTLVAGAAGATVTGTVGYNQK